MNDIVKRLESQLRAKGKDKKSAERIALSTLQRSGSVKRGSTALTAKGKARSAMGDSGRAKDRAAKASGRSTRDYKYDPKTNRATLK